MLMNCCECTYPSPSIAWRKYNKIQICDAAPRADKAVWFYQTDLIYLALLYRDELVVRVLSLCQLHHSDVVVRRPFDD